jgi:2-methylisocitrate lyase-like PEP mutase family enzyme
MNELTRRLQSKLQPGAGLLIPGAANALAARIAADAGFDAVYLTGAGVANSHLGVPDIGLTSVTELAEHVAAMREAVELPIVADGDTGFGNALNLRRTVRLYERAGANAIQLEDQVFPKRCGHFEGKQVIARQEMVQKIKAAVDARQDGMLILARTDARAVEGLSGAVDRMNAYREAGADLLFLEAPVDQAELASIPKSVPGPHVCNLVFGGKTPMLPREQLAAMGFAGILYANALLQAAMIAMQNVAGHLRSRGSLAGAESLLISFAGRQKLVDHERYQALEKRYAGS